MLFCGKSILTGMSSHPRVRRVLPSMRTALLLHERRSVHHPTITFKARSKIPYTAGGCYGDEFRPD
jgi:hypothetical protein